MCASPFQRSHAADVADRLLRNAAISEAPADARPTDSAATLMGSAETARSPAADRQSDAADSMEVNRGDGEEVKATHARDQALPALPEDSKAPEAKAVATVENSTGSGGSKAAGDANDGRKKKEVKGEYGDLFLVLADAWAFAGDDSRARELYYILQELPEFSRDTNVSRNLCKGPRLQRYRKTFIWGLWTAVYSLGRLRGPTGGRAFGVVEIP